jgi:hypothetical protein
MNTAIVKNVACAKNGSPTLFVESKSGNVYKFNTSVPADRAPTIIAKIKAAGVINIKLWTKVREGVFVKHEPRIFTPKGAEILTEAPSSMAELMGEAS